MTRYWKTQGSSSAGTSPLLPTSSPTSDSTPHRHRPAVLFIEEIQSGGRRRGGRRVCCPGRKWQQTENRYAIWLRSMIAGGIHKIDKAVSEPKAAQVRSRERLMNWYQNHSPPLCHRHEKPGPPAPEADDPLRGEENGYDAIAWTTGEQQVKRYQKPCVKSPIISSGIAQATVRASAFTRTVPEFLKPM